MAYIRKETHAGGKFTWRAEITTSEGKRRSKSFPRKGDAEAWARANDKASASGSSTMTFRALAISHNEWFDGLVRDGERGQRTADGYASHLKNYLPVGCTLAKARLSEVDAPMLQAHLNDIVTNSGSETARRVKVTFSAWLAHGDRSGWIKGNPVENCKIVKKRRRKAEARIEIPSKDDLGRLLDAAEQGDHAIRDTAVLSLLIYAGLRASELLGLADDAVQLTRNGGTVRVVERLCSVHVTLGDVKSEEGYREIPIGPSTSAAIKAWRLLRGPQKGGISKGVKVSGRLFPAPNAQKFGPLWPYQDFRRHCWYPMAIRAGLGGTAPDKKGVQRPYADFGPHTMRHVYASMQIDNGVPPKRLQKLLGHATLAMTMDLYGHLWADPEGDQALAEAVEKSIPRGVIRP